MFVFFYFLKKTEANHYKNMLHNLITVMDEYEVKYNDLFIQA